MGAYNSSDVEHCRWSTVLCSAYTIKTDFCKFWTVLYLYTL